MKAWTMEGFILEQTEANIFYVQGSPGHFNCPEQS